MDAANSSENASPRVGPEPTLGEISAQLGSLSDLFRRRLVDDKDKRRMLDELVQELDDAREERLAAAVLPLYREILLVVDRAWGMNEDNAGSLGDELVEILLRSGVEPVRDDGPFDPSIHEAIESVSTADPSLVGTVASVQRNGYTSDGRLVRPARVAVFAIAEDAADVAAESDDAQPAVVEFLDAEKDI